MVLVARMVEVSDQPTRISQRMRVDDPVLEWSVWWP